MSVPPPPGDQPSGAPSTETPPAGSPPPGGSAAPRRLTRRLEGRLLGGVATGLAAYLGIDVVVVRIALVVLAFVPFPGFGVLVYLAMLLLVPVGDDGAAIVPSRFGARGPGFWVGLALIGVATFALLGVSTDGRFGGGLLPLLLIGLGIALWVDADRRASRDRPADSAGASTWSSTPVGAPPAPSWTQPSAAPPTPPPTTPPVGPPAPPPASPAASSQPSPAWQPPPVHRRPRSPLGRVTLGLALVAGGAAWLLDLLDQVTLPTASIFAVVLLVLGVGLLVGSVLGRARWLAILVALLVPLTLVASVLEELSIDLGSGIDTRSVTLEEIAQLDDPIRLGAGELVVDATALGDPGDGVIDASLGAGELRLVLPDGAGLSGTAQLEVGELLAPDGRRAGVGVERGFDLAADPGRPTYEVDLRVGAGEIRIEQEAAR